MDPARDNLDQLSPILSSLAPVREHVTAITNLELQNAYPAAMPRPTPLS